MAEHLTIDEIAQARAGVRSQEEALLVEQHVSACPACAQQAELICGVTTALATADPIAMPTAVATRLDAVIAAEVDRRATLAAKTDTTRSQHVPTRPAAAQPTNPAGATPTTNDQLRV